MYICLRLRAVLNSEEDTLPRRPDIRNIQGQAGSYVSWSTFYKSHGPDHDIFAPGLRLVHLKKSVILKIPVLSCIDDWRDNFTS